MSERTLTPDGLVVEAPDAIYTYTGRLIRPLQPRPEDIAISDVAHHLSQICRFTGASRKFYSVAEHCVRVGLLVSKAASELALEALLHDASEAYLSDMARPVKRAEDFLFYRIVEARLEQAVHMRFGLPYRSEMHPVIRWADQYSLEAEVAFLHHKNFRERMHVSPGADSLGAAWMNEAIPAAWPPLVAESNFKHLFEEWGGKA